MRPKGSPAALEVRRREAIRLLNEGVSLAEVARVSGCHVKSVSRWKKINRTGGTVALAARPNTGRPAALNPRQKQSLTRRLLAGGLKNGFATDLWTTPRIVKLIKRHYLVSYHHDHIGRLMAAMGFTCQKPKRLAAERDEKAIRHWITRDWPRIKKKHNASRLASFSSTKAGY